ncbi:MAG: glycoside-pentoside-hexuronide (GPH):cation symporter [Pseudomonadota bacterium]
MPKLRRLAGYGIGDFGLNIYWNTLSLYLIYWYTTVVGLKPEVAGTIYLIGMLWDAVSDPVVASLSERVRTKHGTYRPFLLYGSFALGIGFVALFWIPPFQGMTLLFVLVATGILFRTSYTLVAIPYSAMSARITFSSLERTELSGVRMFFAFAGLLAVSNLLPPLARHFSGQDQYTASGFQLAITVGAIVATLSLLACFLGTSEKPLPAGTQKTPLRLGDLVNALLKNRALVLLLCVIFLQSGATASIMISMVFLIEANQPVFANKEVILTGFAIASMCGVPFWTIFIRLFHKKLAWSAASFGVAAIGFHLWAFGPLVIHGTPLQIILLGFIMGAFAVLLWSFIPDAVEYGQITTGGRSEGVVFGSALVVQKMSGGLMGFVVGVMLSAIGYDSSMELQSAEAAQGLVAFMAICPATLLLISSCVIWFFPLDRKIHADIIEKLGGAEATPGAPERTG